MDAVLLARLQFALTICFHYVFPPISIGLGLLLVIMQGLYLRTRDGVYREMMRFWLKVFALTFTLGTATGIVMEFEFGTNWSRYSRFVGDVFGSPLAAEGVLAFFLESVFLGILIFGWDRVSERAHFFSTIMVALGAHLSALWIIVANSWQQTPAGFHLVGSGNAARAEITDFWGMVFNPSTIERYTHAITGAWQAGAWLVVSVSAWYLLQRRHEKLARRALAIGLVVALAASLGQLMTGHASAVGVARHQPAKLAAFEGRYAETPRADLYLFGWVDEDRERVQLGLALPGVLDWLVQHEADEPLAGLHRFAPADRPPVNLVFQAYHLMVAIGMLLIGLSALGVVLLRKGVTYRWRWLLWACVVAVLGPQIANQVGWISAEVGRQPWIVYGLLRTRDAISPTVPAGNVLFSLILFALIYLALLALYLYLLTAKIRRGPADPDAAAPVGGTR